MASKADITADYARQLLDYNPATGDLIWRHRPIEMFRNRRGWITFKERFAGKTAGCLCKLTGYILVRIDGRLYRAHRVVYLIVRGAWPKDELDHEKGGRADNRIELIRDANRVENSQNLPMKASNTSGYTGVSWHKPSSKWCARIRSNGKYLHLGLFDDPRLAAKAYLDAKKKYHPFNPTVRAA